MNKLALHIPLLKIDEEKRLVFGRAVQEVADKSGEILDYATAVPAFQQWSDDVSARSNGLSKGNVRSMHDAKSSAGKVVHMDFDDTAKAIDVCVKVVDDNEWKKCLEGVYTGFSVGGSYARKWKDPVTGLTKYTPRVAELSLVDNPCIPTCKFVELQKADGSTGTVELKGRASTFAEALAKLAGGHKDGPSTFEEALAKARDGDGDGKVNERRKTVAGAAVVGVSSIATGTNLGHLIGEARGMRNARGVARNVTGRLRDKADRSQAEAALDISYAQQGSAAGARTASQRTAWRNAGENMANAQSTYQWRRGAEAAERVLRRSGNKGARVGATVGAAVGLGAGLKVIHDGRQAERIAKSVTPQELRKAAALRVGARLAKAI